MSPDFARTEREPVVAVSEGGINLGQKRGLRKRGRQVTQHHLRPIQRTLHAKTLSSLHTLTVTVTTSLSINQSINQSTSARTTISVGLHLLHCFRLRGSTQQVYALIPKKTPKLPCTHKENNQKERKGLLCVRLEGNCELS